MSFEIALDLPRRRAASRVRDSPRREADRAHRSLGRRQDHAAQLHRRAASGPIAGHDRHRRRDAVRLRGGRRPSARTAPRGATCSRTCRLFPHLRVAANLAYGERRRPRRWMTPRRSDSDSSASAICSALAGDPLGRRGQARGDRPRAARRAELPPARRAVGLARPPIGPRRSCA